MQFEISLWMLLVICLTDHLVAQSFLEFSPCCLLTLLLKKKCSTPLKTLSLRFSHILCSCLFTWKQRRIEDKSHIKKHCCRIRSLLHSLKLANRFMINFQLPLSASLLLAYFLIWKQRRILNACYNLSY